MKKVLLITIPIVLIIGGAVGYFIWNSTFKTIEIDLASNISNAEIKYTGENGSGVARFDASDLKNAADYPSEKRAKEFMEGVTYEIVPSSELKNDQSIEVVAKYSRSIADEKNIKVTNYKKSLIVTGLKEEEQEQEKKKASSDVTINLYDPNAGNVYSDYNVPVEEDDTTDELTPSEAQKAINDIYAEHGYIFSNKTWQNYYNGKSWYEPRYRSQSDAEKTMTKTEKENIDYLAKVVKGKI